MFTTMKKITLMFLCGIMMFAAAGNAFAQTGGGTTGPLI
jgi:hypothetical protein